MKEIDKNKLAIRISTLEDGDIMKGWLNEPGILKWFPMTGDKEVEDSVHFWLTHISQKSAYSLTYDGKVCGMCVLYLHRYQKLKHQTLFAVILDKDFRGKGLGKYFMEYVLKEAKDTHHIEKIHLEVYDGNPAIPLYEKLGFVRYGYHPNFLKEKPGQYLGKILMEKSLK